MRVKRIGLFRKLDKQTLIAVLCGVVCAICVIAYMMQIRSEASATQREMLEKYGGDQVEVCVATRDIAGGESVRESDIETKMWIASMLPDGAITKRGDIVGKQLGSSVLKGEVFSKNRLQGTSSTLEVPEGKVAVSVPLDETSAVGGSLTANQQVDLYATGSSTTTKIASNVQILETSKSQSSSSAETKWITLAVSKDRVAEIVSAAQKLELYVVLPSPSASSKEVEDEDDK